ncbi:hypothetical protein C8Q76DRAFT_209651 [Earliella scabrosa]|nr:hypothetical protein C8Q76DRAFT_209651 [Earliella scabrosa]
MHAVIAGDLSGTIVHRAFVHVAQVFGSLLWQHDHRTVFMLATPLEEEHLRCLLISLHDIDPVTEIHVRYILACYHLLKNQAKEGDEQLGLAADIVRTHHLDFPTSSIEGQVPTEEQRELVNTLAHLMYLDRCSAFVFPTMVIRLPPDFDGSFKNTANAFPELTKTEPNYLRTQSLLFLIRVTELEKESSSLTPQRPDLDSSQPSATDDLCRALLQDVTTHAENLIAQILTMSSTVHRERSIALKYCLIVTLSAKAKVHWMLCDAEPNGSQLALDMVVKIVEITRTFADTDFIFLDPVLGLCWASVVAIVREAKTKDLLDKKVSWRSELDVLHVSAKKLGYEIPFMDNSHEVIGNVVSAVGA